MDILETIGIQSCHEQGSLSWFRDRLGCITSSQVYHILGKTAEEKEFIKLQSSKLKKGETEEMRELALKNLSIAIKSDPLTEGAKSYLREVAAERNLQQRYIEDDDLFQEYLYRTSISTKSIRYGSDNEAIAREVYRNRYNMDVVECGFIRHTQIDMYGDSPDGIVLNADGKPFRAIEIKFPNPDNWMLYAEQINDAQSLKEVKPEYYWQCMSHIECCRRYFGCEDCDFIFMDKMQRDGFRCVNIKPNEDDIQNMLERIVKANEYIDLLIQKIRSNGQKIQSRDSQ